MEALLTGELLAFGGADLAVLLLVLLVRDEENQSVRLALVLDLLKPVRQVHEGVHRGEVVGHEDGVRALVKDLRDRLEGLLAGRVPYLQLHVDVLHAHEQAAELDAHRHLVILRKLIVAHAMHQTRLADATVAYHDQLEQLVLLK